MFWGDIHAWCGEMSKLFERQPAITVAGDLVTEISFARKGQRVDCHGLDEECSRLVAYPVADDLDDDLSSSGMYLPDSLELEASCLAAFDRRARVLVGAVAPTLSDVEDRPVAGVAKRVDVVAELRSNPWKE